MKEARRGYVKEAASDPGKNTWREAGQGHASGLGPGVKQVHTNRSVELEQGVKSGPLQRRPGSDMAGVFYNVLTCLVQSTNYNEY